MQAALSQASRAYPVSPASLAWVGWPWCHTLDVHVEFPNRSSLRRPRTQIPVLSTFHAPYCSENQIAKLLFFLRCQIGVVFRLHYQRDVSGCQITHKSRLVVVCPCQIARLGVPCRKCQIDPISRLSYGSCFFPDWVVFQITCRCSRSPDRSGFQIATIGLARLARTCVSSGF